MSEEFNISDIYDKNLNFLIGSGASVGLCPTLQLGVMDADGSPHTIETLATEFEKVQMKKTALFMHYYKECIEPVLEWDITKQETHSKKGGVIENYKKFIKTILHLLRKKKGDDFKRCNIFTTNYDNCIEYVGDEIIKSGSEDFILNDGSRGFLKRYLTTKNYNSYVKQSGLFNNYSIQIPQLNLLHLHGSFSWKKEQENILVDYLNSKEKFKINGDVIPDISQFSQFLKDNSKNMSDIPEINITENQEKMFWEKYDLLPIVNPTKWKFHETLFEEHYYQMLRYLSYELEKPNTVLITFGFSFADRHILELIKRSLSNPSLQLFVSCFNKDEYKLLEKNFEQSRNVICLDPKDEKVDFSEFNKNTFTLEEPSS